MKGENRLSRMSAALLSAALIPAWFAVEGGAAIDVGAGRAEVLASVPSVLALPLVGAAQVRAPLALAAAVGAGNASAVLSVARPIAAPRAAASSFAAAAAEAPAPAAMASSGPAEPAGPAAAASPSDLSSQLPEVANPRIRALVAGALPELLPVQGPPDAKFLIQTKYGYAMENESFSGPMARAILRTTEALQRHLRQGETLSPKRSRELMDSIAQDRFFIALDSRDKDAHLYGYPIPETEEDSKEPLSDLLVYDALTDDPHDRHYPYFASAKRFAELKADRRITVDGEVFLASFSYMAGPHLIRMMHPTYDEMIPLRRKGFAILSAAISDPGISERAFLDRLAAAYQLFVHATPYERGSPSIIEAFYDAALRAKFGKTLPGNPANPSGTPSCAIRVCPSTAVRSSWTTSRADDLRRPSRP